MVLEWISGRVFNTVHRNNLVYNTCWEDPRLDRVALELGPEDDVLVITSAGCNALDYAITGPNHVYAVDMNPRQNALLELKISAIKNLDYEDFFKMFGQGHYPGIQEVYRDKLRDGICDWSQKFWDKKINFFDSRRSFYFRGTSGAFARMVNLYIDRVIKSREAVGELLDAGSLEEQDEIWNKQLKKKFWKGLIKFAMGRDATLSMLGVPKAQRRQIDKQYNGGIVKFVEDCLDNVFTKIPVHDNYFWRVYLTGCYTQDCSPEYLKPDNFETLKAGLADRITCHTDSVQGFLEKHDGRISRFVLLDHMDWLSDKFFPLLETEWQAILDKSAKTSRVIWRSGGLQTDFIDQVSVIKNGSEQKINESLTYYPELADELHVKDRVHTYASFYIADLSV
ncbi:MAG: BtaA family protein [Planctomycetota bacterium]|nr:BtaA family protein [Planctomycetota bacterium]